MRSKIRTRLTLLPLLGLLLLTPPAAYSQVAPGYTFSTLLHFGEDAALGSAPYGPLAFGTDGHLYGTTSVGGSGEGNTNANWFGGGTIFRYNLATDTGETLVNLSSIGITGYHPEAGLTLASDGRFYGVTTYGGSGTGTSNIPGAGTLFRYDPNTSAFEVVVTFGTGEASGTHPAAELTLGSDGNLYGVTQGGGSNSGGTLFRYNPLDDSFETLDDSFSNTGPADNPPPAFPLGQLTAGSDGALYGTTQGGGTGHGGTLFRYDPAGDTLQVLAHFGSPGIPGTLPVARVTFGGDGNLYGTTHLGGDNGGGTFFRYNLVAGTVDTLVSFPTNAVPYAGVTLGSDGSLYGSTQGSGNGNAGTLFRFDPFTSSFTTVVHFGTPDVAGSVPAGELLLGSDGSLYGTTNGFSTIFRLTFVGGASVTPEPGSMALLVLVGVLSLAGRRPRSTR